MGGMMNKSELIEALAKEKDLPLRKAEEVVNTVFGEMENALINEERVEIRGLGSFKVKDYDGYKGPKPQNGRDYQCRPEETPFFQGRKGIERKSRHHISSSTIQRKPLVALDGELAVPLYPKSAYAGLKILLEIPDSRCVFNTLGLIWTSRNRHL